MNMTILELSLKIYPLTMEWKARLSRDTYCCTKSSQSVLSHQCSSPNQANFLSYNKNNALSNVQQYLEDNDDQWKDSVA